MKLRAAAESASCGFVNPATVRRPDQIAARRGYDWATAVLGRPYPGVGNISRVEARLIEAADGADINPQLPQWLLDERAAAS